MKQALWLYHEADPVSSGELRRLALPALMVEASGWRCAFVHAAVAGLAEAADVVICPLRAADALARLPSRCGPILIELDSGCLDPALGLGAILHALSNRIAGIVSRSPRVAHWGERILANAHVESWVIPDIGSRSAELCATALRFGVPFPMDDARALPARFELWFSEPGDAVSDNQLPGLQDWLAASHEHVVIAPAPVRAWLNQIGGLRTEFDWSPALLARALPAARRCVFFGQPSYAQLRRCTTALRSGATVLAPKAPAAAPNGPLEVGARWSALLESIGQPAPALEDCGPALVFLDLVQDVDLVLPIIDELKRRGVSLRVAMTGWLRRRSPRAQVELAARGVEPEVVSREAVASGLAPELAGVGSVISPAESSLAAHGRAHTLFQHARAARIPTFSLQHGVENVGLSRLEGESDEPSLASDHLFAWFPATAMPAAVAPSLRPRLHHVGRSVALPTEMQDLRAALNGFRSIVAVFENLHWDRYDRAWRNQFLSDCLEFAAVDPQRCVVLKPHHAGLWSTRHTHLFPQWPKNLVLADPADPFWEPFTAPSLLQIADLVVTTPSTVALDAVQAGKPVAIAAYGLDLPAYAPLPLLHSLQDWLAFSASGPSTTDAQRRASFLVRTAWGDAAGARMVDHVIAAMRERASARGRPSGGGLEEETT